MEKRCCVPGCSGHVDVHPLPANAQVREKWLLKINETNNPLLENVRPAANEDELACVCSLHFVSSDFVYSVDENLEFKKELATSAVPSIFPWSGENWENVIINHKLIQITNSYCAASSVSISNHDEISDELFQGGIEIGNVESLGIAVNEEESVTISSVIPNTVEDNNLSSTAGNSEIIGNIVIKKEVQQYQPLQFYRCKYHNCMFKTSFEAKFKRHNQEKHPKGRKGHVSFGNQRLACSHCGFVTTSRQNLEKHELLHNCRDNPFQCSHCSYSVKTLSHLVTHKKRVHSEMESQNEIGYNSVIQPQPDDQAASEISEATTHQQKSRGWKRKKKPGRNLVEKLIEASVFHCPYCSFWSKILSSFHDHVLSHSKTPAFRCSICSQASKTRPSIHKHINLKRRMDFNHYYARCIRSVSPPRDEYVGHLRTSLVPQKTQCGRFSDTTQEMQITAASHSNTGEPSAIEDLDEASVVSNDTCEPGVVLADPIQHVALESWENILASDNLTVLAKFLHTLERTKINENDLQEESKLCKEQLDFLKDKIRSPYDLMREARQDHDISLMKIPELRLKVEDERSKLQQLADTIKQHNEEEERLNSLLAEVKSNQNHIDRKERLPAQINVFQAQQAKCSYQLEEDVEEGAALVEMDERISKAQEKLEEILQQMKEIQLKRDQLEVELRDVAASKKGLQQLHEMTEPDFQVLNTELNAVMELKSSADERLKQMIAATQIRIRIYSVLEERLNRTYIIDKRERWLATLDRYYPTDVDLTSTMHTDEK